MHEDAACSQPPTPAPPGPSSVQRNGPSMLLHAGQPELCLEVWAEAPAAEAVPAHAAPLRHWLHSLRSLFPGHAGPYLRALRCLSSSPASAISADMHLKAATEVACLHEERALAQGSAPERGSGGRLWATAWLPAAGLHGVVIPEVQAHVPWAPTPVWGFPRPQILPELDACSA